MLSTIARLWRRHRLLTVAFAVAIAFTAFFAVRTTVSFVFWANHRDEPIAPWMTVRYISNSYSLPPFVIAEAAGLTPGERDRRPIGEIVHDNGEAFDAVKARIEQAILDERAAIERGEPTPQPKPPEPPEPPDPPKPSQ